MAKAARRFGNIYPSRTKELHYHSDFFFDVFKPTPYVVPKLGEKLTVDEKYEQITTPWTRLKLFHDVRNPVASRLPTHYKKFYWEWKFAPKAIVHSKPKQGNFRLSKDGLRVEHVKDENIQVVYPNNCDDGLWGGEGVVKGFRDLGKMKGQQARYWFPDLYDSVLYSEVLDKHFKIVVTKRLLNLVDDHYGLDNYLLKTPYADINSVLGFKMKAQILSALAHRTLYPHKETAREDMLLKYGHLLQIPAEEIEWLGLRLTEAVTKQVNLEKKNKKDPTPLKHLYREQLVEYLKENKRLEDEHKAINGPSEPEKKPAFSFLSSMSSKFKFKGPSSEVKKNNLKNK